MDSSREEEIREESLGDLRLFANLVFQCYYWSAFLKVQRPNGALYLTSKLFLVLHFLLTLPVCRCVVCTHLCAWGQRLMLVILLYHSLSYF